MRTGNKLLLSFVAFAVLLMLLTDILLWANFKRGITGNEDNPEKNEWHTSALQPVKVIKIESHNNYNVRIEKADSFKIGYQEDTLHQVLYSQNGDTLLVHPEENNNVVIYCPQIELVLLSKSGVTMYNMDLARLQVVAGDSCSIELINNIEIGSLHVTGGRENSFNLNGKVDSLYLELGPGGSFRSDDVPYKFTSMKLDSLNELNLTGSSLKALKEIK